MTPAPEPREALVRQWLVEARVAPDVQANIDRLARSEGVRHVAILPDAHLGRDINNGCVAAVSGLVYPQAVGNDIGCGLSAIRFDGPAECLADDGHAQDVLRQLYRRVPALKQPAAHALPESLASLALSCDKLAKASRRDGAWQLGSLGCGNHFVEFQKDDAGRLWAMVHSGSRAMGPAIAQFHLARAAVSSTGLKFLDTRAEAGQAYLNDMNWAVQYATLNRLALLANVVEIVAGLFSIPALEESYIDTPHNFARREEHYGENFIVHRKSANSARLDETGLIAGSMGSPSFVARGLGAEASLCSSSHGAGRALSRTEAQRRIKPAEMKHQLGAVKYDPRCLTELRDEAPAAYREIREVMQAQRELARQETRLAPVLNFKYPDRRRG